MPKPYLILNSSDVAKILGVGASTLSNWRARGRAENNLPDPDYVTTGGAPLWDPETVEAWIAERNAEAFARYQEIKGG
jgi:transposase